MIMDTIASSKYAIPNSKDGNRFLGSKFVVKQTTEKALATRAIQPKIIC